MKRVLNVFLMLMVLCLGLSVQTQASKPVSATLEGCVIKGVFFSVEKGVASKTGTRTRVYRMEVQKPDWSTLDLSRYEGKKIRMQGRLHPGDIFVPDPKSLKILGKCDRDSKIAISESSE